MYELAKNALMTNKFWLLPTYLQHVLRIWLQEAQFSEEAVTRVSIVTSCFANLTHKLRTYKWVCKLMIFNDDMAFWTPAFYGSKLYRMFISNGSLGNNPHTEKIIKI